MSYNEPQDGQAWQKQDQPTIANPALNQPGPAPSPPPATPYQPQQNPYQAPAANQPPGSPYQTPSLGNQAPQNPYQTPSWQQGANPYGQQHASSSNPIIALLLSILGTICCCTLMAPVGLYLGKSEMNAIDQGLRDPGQRGTAQAAFVIGIIGTAILVLAVIYYLGLFLVSL